MGIRDNFEETIVVENKGEKIIGRWTPYLISMPHSAPIERWHLLIDIERETSVEHGSNHASERESDAREKVVAKKMELLREEYGIASLPCVDEKIAMGIIESSWEGKWVGQHDDSYVLRTGTLNMVLAGVVDSFEVNNMLRELHTQEMLGFNGAILVPWHEEREAYASWEKSTGHKRIVVSDSGIWHCDFCKKFGDEQSDSRAYACLVEDEKTA